MGTVSRRECVISDVSKKTLEMKTALFIFLLVLVTTSGHSMPGHLPPHGTYTIERLLPLCISDYPSQLKADTLVGQTIEFEEGQIIYRGISHDIDSVRDCVFGNGEYHDANCDSVKYAIKFKDLENSRHGGAMVEYLLTFRDDFAGPGNHLLFFNYENIVIGFNKHYYKLNAVDLPSDFSIDFTIHPGWKKVNDSLFVLKDFKKEFSNLYPFLSQGHQPWQGDPRFAAAACFWEFGMKYKFSDVFLFGSRLMEVKKQEIYSVEVQGKTYLMHLRTKKGIPVPYKLEIKNHTSRTGD